MKTDELLVLALAGAAVFLILKAGGVKIGAKATGLSYTPTAGYGDTSRYDAYAPTAKQNGGWGIE